ncbi:unnamed protein product, partial [marine sediment metagenome]
MFFEEKGHIYRVKRGRTFTKTQKSSEPLLEFECLTDDDNSRSSHRKGNTQEALDETINIDYDIFCSSLMFGQNDSGKFLTGTDKTRKEMMINILHLEDVVKGCLQEVRDRKNAKLTVIEELQVKINLTKERMDSKDSIAQVKEKIKAQKSLISSFDKERVKHTNKRDKLSSSDKITKVNAIKEEGKTVKLELQSKKEQLDSQTKEWRKLLDDAT